MLIQPHNSMTEIDQTQDCAGIQTKYWFARFDNGHWYAVLPGMREMRLKQGAIVQPVDVTCAVMALT